MKTKQQSIRGNYSNYFLDFVSGLLYGVTRTLSIFDRILEIVDRFLGSLSYFSGDVLLGMGGLRLDAEILDSSNQLLIILEKREKSGSKCQKKV